MRKMINKLALFLLMLAGFGFVFSACSDGGSSGGGNKKSGSDPVTDSTNDSSGIEIPALEVTETYSVSAGSLASAYEDASLYIKFDAAPTVNRTASVKGNSSATKAVKILKSDGTVVDTIYASSEQITSQASNDSYKTINVKDQLISVNGTVVVIKPHTALDASTAYYVTVDDGLLSGKVGGADFAGISSADTFAFTTRATPSISENTITIGKDKDYSKVQSAFDYLAGKSGDYTIEIDAGYYNERLSFANANVNVTMVGVDENDGDLGANTVIYWKNNNGKDGDSLNDGWNPASRTRTAFLYEGKNLTIKHLTFANTISRTVTGKEGTQAEAFYYDAKGYLVAYDSSFKSHQDTLLLGNQAGRGWFYKCYIEGDTDFIWGYPDTILFEECQIRCLYDSAPAVTNHTSYIFASRSMHTANSNKGLVLFNSKISVDDGVTAYYGRNSGSDTQAAVVFNTFEKIDSSLWYEGSGKYDEDNESVCSVGYKDYGNKYTDGTTIDTSNRKEGCYGLSKDVAEREYCGRNAILNRGWDATNRIYKACTTPWDLSEFEEEFNASADASKNMIYVEPTYVPYLEGEASTSFTFFKYDGTTVDASIEVDNTELASASSASVTAVAGKTGEVYVIATSGDMRGVARVKVIPQVIEATGLTLNKTEAFAIDKDDKTTLTAEFTPADTTDQSITWTSSNTNVLRVTGSGALENGLEATVTGFGVGTATITATSTKTPTVFASVEITVNEVYAVRYLQESTGYSLAASIDHRDVTVVANPVSYGFAGEVELAELSDADKGWGNNGYKFTSKSTVAPEAGGDICWADFVIRAAGAVKIKAITADAYCSATSNLRGIVYTKVGSGSFAKKGEVEADAKAMSFDKVDISTEVASGETVTVRVAIALLEGKTVSKAITGVIGGVVIYYDIEGTPVAFPGADGDYNIIDYATAEEKVKQGTAIADGSSADGMVSWANVTYHSEGYGLQIPGNENATITIKVGGPSVISMVSSTYSAGTITVTNSANEVIASGSTKVATDKTPFSFLYTGSGEDTLTVAFSGSTSYIGKINVKELTTEVAEVTSVKINGAETVSTAAPVKFTAAVEATYMASPEVTWSSGDEATATVAEDGTVTGVKAGTVTITATSAIDSTKSDTVTVTITEDKPAQIVYDFAVVDPTATTGITATNISWNQSKYAQGSKNAKLELEVLGNCKITVAYCYQANATISAEGQKSKLIYTASKSTSKIEEIEYIDAAGEGTVTINYAGTSYINSITIDYDDSITSAETAVVNSITVASETVNTVKLGEEITLVATVDATYVEDMGVTWSSADDSIATVASDGKVTGVTAGKVKITATSSFDSSKSGELEIEVVDSNAIDVATTITFGSAGNYKDGTIDISNITIGDNGESNSQVKEGFISFEVLKGAAITVHGYSGYTSYIISDGTTTTSTITAEYNTFIASSDSVITITPQSGNNYFYSIEISYPIVSNTTVSFGSSGNYKSVTTVDFSNITVGDNGGDNSQVKNGYLTFGVLAGAKVIVNGYPSYTSYKLSDGSTETDTITDSVYTYTATSNCTITITPQSGNNYFYSFVIVYPISSDTSITFGTAGNYTSVRTVDFSTATLRDNGGNNSQFSAGYITFDVLAGASITINSYSGYTSYIITDGTTPSDTITGTEYTYSVEADSTIRITPQDSNNYFYSISITY